MQPIITETSAILKVPLSNQGIKIISLTHPNANLSIVFPNAPAKIKPINTLYQVELKNKIKTMQPIKINTLKKVTKATLIVDEGINVNPVFITDLIPKILKLCWTGPNVYSSSPESPLGFINKKCFVNKSKTNIKEAKTKKTK